MLQQFTIVSAKFKADTGWFVAQTDKGESVVGVAILPPSGPITAEGNWETHSTYGKQFKTSKIFFEDALVILTSLLASGFLTGIKRSKAQKVVDVLGEDVFRVLDGCIVEPPQLIEWHGQMRSPHEILLTVNGIGKIVAVQILEAWKARRGIMNVAILGIRAGMTGHQFREALSILGSEVLAQKILSDPYGLTILSCFKWEDVDLIAQLSWEGKEKIELDSPQRLGAAVREVVSRQQANGHMCFPLETSMRDAELLSSVRNVQKIVEPRFDEFHLLTHGSMLATKELYTMEQGVARNLNRLQQSAFRKPFDSKPIVVGNFSDLTLGPEQEDAVYMALNSNVSIITGGPGSGKTTIIKTLIKILDHYDISYTLSSFIAKVAIRMREVTGAPACTLHSYFKLFKDKEDQEKLDTDYLIIDEMSTIGMDLLSPILDLIPSGCRVVFVGDHNQLPPIGPGEPLAQMLRAQMPATILTHIYRQDRLSGIVLAAHEILEDRVPQNNGLDFISAAENEYNIGARTVKALRHLTDSGIPFEDIQVLTPINSGPAGRTALNKYLQQVLNSNNLPIGSTAFRMGDRVIHTVNNRKLEVMNGEVGTVVKMNIDQQTSEDLVLAETDVWAPEFPILWVRYPMHTTDVAYTKSTLKELQLAYAITVHKSIGSEFRAIVLVLTHTRDDFMKRQLPYTAITRASEMCVVISAPGAFEKFVSNSQKFKRFSLLADLLSSNLEKKQ